MKLKAQVMLENDLVRRIDDYCKKIGISRSAACAMWIARGFEQDCNEREQSKNAASEQ